MKERMKSQHYHYQGKIINLRVDEAILENDKVVLREVVEHPGGVGILAIDGDDVLLVRQFRYPYQEMILEIPAGKLESNENPYDTGLRELYEEVGAITNKMVSLGKMYPSPGYSNEIIHLFLATEFTLTKNQLDEDEFLSVERIPLKRAYQMIENQELMDAKTVLALLLYKNLFERM